MITRVAMVSQIPTVLPSEARSDWVRLRTLVLLRWMAILGQSLGQSAAVLVATFVYGIDLPLIPCLVVIGAAVVGNLIAIQLWPESRRLGENQTRRMQLVDLVQLSGLISLTGGLTNPFALLVLAPVTISARACQGRDADPRSGRKVQRDPEVHGPQRQGRQAVASDLARRPTGSGIPAFSTTTSGEAERVTRGWDLAALSQKPCWNALVRNCGSSTGRHLPVTQTRPTRSGAVVEAAWPLERIEVMRGRALGANKALQRPSLAATRTRKRRGFANF